jgi:hypothetical protein
VFPAHRHLVSQVMTPLYFGELGIVIWLAVMGAKVLQVKGQPSHMS